MKRTPVLGLAILAFFATTAYGGYVAPGSHGVLRGLSKELCPVGTTGTGMEEFLKANRAGDADGVLQLLLLGKVFTVANGTRIAVLDYGGLFKRKIRILEGPHTGLVGYVPSEWIK